MSPIIHPSAASRITRADRRRKKAARRRRTAIVWLASLFGSTFVLIGAMIVVGFATPWGIRARLLIAETIVSTRHYYLARYITTPSEYAALLKGLSSTPVLKSSTKAIHVTTGAEGPSVITVIPIAQNGYTGDVMLIHNPRLIRLVPAVVHNGEGEYITDMAARVGAIAGINASGFEDPNGEGWGGVPVGLEYVNGQTLMASKTTENWATVGFTSNGVLVLGDYTTAQLKVLGVRDAMQFHPELVVDGQPMITQGDGGWGADPRTAIGQAKDGTVIFVVINGRLHGGSIGATQRDVMNIMLKYGAWNACAMDGGSSSVMYDQGQIINSPSTIDPNGQRHLPDAWLVFPTAAAANAAN